MFLEQLKRFSCYCRLKVKVKLLLKIAFGFIMSTGFRVGIVSTNAAYADLRHYYEDVTLK